MKILRNLLLPALGVALLGFAQAGDKMMLDQPAPTSKDLFAEWWEGDYALGDWGGARTDLEDKGLTINILNASEGWYNVSGGIETGGNLVGYWEWGFEWDFEPTLGWKGGSIVVDGNWYYGGLPSDELIGAFPATALSSYESSNAIRMYHMYFQQTWGQEFGNDSNGANPSDVPGYYLFKIGQFAADDDFLGSVYMGLFANASFGQYPKEAGATAAPAYRLTAPGVYFYAQPVEEWFVRVGAFSGNAGDDIVSNNGFGWRWGGATGIASFAETGVNVDLNGLPGVYLVGGFYDTSEFTAFDGSTVNNNWNVWFTIDQAVLMQSNGTDTLVGLSFRMVPGPSNNRNPIDWGLQGAVVVFGEPWGRPQDQFGIGVANVNFPTETIAGNLNPSEDQTIVEVTYAAQVNPWLTIQPNIQFFQDPSLATEDAVAIGLRVVTVF
ncbi:MAG: carbohydrate porin [Verrucomicrobiota bacterium]